MHWNTHSRSPRLAGVRHGVFSIVLIGNQIAEYEREDYQTPALLEVRILADSVSGCRYRWLALPPRSRAVCRIGVALPVMVFPPGCGAVALAVQPVVPPYGRGVNVSSRIL